MQIKEIQKIITETDNLNMTIRKSAATVTRRDTRLQVNSWLRAHQTSLSQLPTLHDVIPKMITMAQAPRLKRKFWLSALRTVRKSLTNAEYQSTTQPTVYQFDPTKPYESYLILKSIIGKTQHTLSVYDAYVDENTLLTLTELPAGTTLKLLTNKTTGKFMHEMPLFKKQYPTSEFRGSPQVHDRFFLVDDECYVIGSSLNSIGGKKYTHIFKVQSEIKDILMSHFNHLWKSGATL